MNIRDVRQEEAVKSYNGNAIIEACPRFGKIKCSIDIFKQNGYKKILIAFPRIDIKESWENDFKYWKYSNDDIEYSTFVSLKKVESNSYDLVIIDEIHEASSAQLRVIKSLKKNNTILGLSGTMTKKTKSEIYDIVGISSCYVYPIEKGVEEGILADYEIIVEKINLDDNKKIYKDNTYTEKKRFRTLEWAMSKSDNPFFIELKVQTLLQNSISKVKRTKDLLREFSNDRILVFCGNTTIANELDIPVYHSKAKDKKLFNDFCTGTGDHLAVVKMAQAGITVKPINRGIINYTSGNPEDSAQKICRFLGMEYSNPNKRAIIHILCTNENYQIERIKTALLFFQQEKVKWI